MYSDYRFCKYCSDNGFYMDGDNYCSKCKEYICFKCSLNHGQKCKQNEQSYMNNVETGGSKLMKDSMQNDFIQQRQLRQYCGENTTIDYSTNSDIAKQYSQFSRCGSSNSVTVKPDHQEQVNHSSKRDNNIRTVDSYKNWTVNTTKPQFKSERIPVTKWTNSSTRQQVADRGGVIRVLNAWPDVSTTTLEGQVLLACPLHPEMNVEHVCTSHNSLCCMKCMSTTHVQCAFQPIDEIANTMNGEYELQRMNGRLDELNILCEHVLWKLQACLQKTDKTQGVQKSTNNTACPRSSSILHASQSGAGGSSPRVNTEKNITACRDIQQHISIGRQELKNAASSGHTIVLFVTLHKNKVAIENLNRNLQVIQSQAKLEGINNAKTLDQPVVKPDHVETTTVPAFVKTYKCPSMVQRTCAQTKNNDEFIESIPNSQEASRQNSFVIGDVILSPCEDPMAHCNNQQDDVLYDTSDDDDVQVVNKITTKDKPKLVQQNSVEFVNKGTHSRSNSRDRIKSYGLVTDYYLKEMTNTECDDSDILRLYSPIPEETINLYADEGCRNTRQSRSTKSSEGLSSDHKETDRSRQMIKWEDKKLLESVELSKETTIYCTQPRRSKKIFESSESELKAVIDKENNDKQKKIRRLNKTRVENANVKKTAIQPKKTHFDKRSMSSTVKFEVETDAKRLQKWIKQTEEMNKIYSNTQSPATLVNKEATKLSYTILEADISNVTNTRTSDSKQPPLMAMKVKNARVVNSARVSSAKSQASDSDESKHKKQTFVNRPKYNVSLSAEYSVRLPEDRMVCHINGVSCLPDGRVVVSDYNNKNIKLIRDGTNKPSVLQLEEPPHDVTSVSHTLMAAIAGLAFDRMYLISVGQCMAVKKRFKTGCECKAVSSYESNIYLLCLFRYKTEVRVLNTDGIVSMRLAFGHSIPTPVDIAINQSNGSFHITDKNNGVYKCSSGRIISRSFDCNIGVYHTVMCGSYNNVFVCTQDPSNICELSKDGRYLMPVVPYAGTLGVNTLAYNEISNSLVAACNKTQTIRVYSIRDCK